MYKEEACLEQPGQLTVGLPPAVIGHQPSEHHENRLLFPMLKTPYAKWGSLMSLLFQGLVIIILISDFVFRDLGRDFNQSPSYPQFP